MENSDMALVAACKSGDHEQFGRLYQNYVKKIYSFIYYKVSDREIAEDLTSTTFLKALENINKCDPNYFSAWIYRIARNTVIDHYRTQKQTEDIEIALEIQGNDDLHQYIEDQDALEAVKQQIKLLPLEHQEIITMRIWDELSFDEIAKVLDKSPASCKMAFYRAIERMQKELGVTAVTLIIALIKQMAG